MARKIMAQSNVFLVMKRNRDIVDDARWKIEGINERIKRDKRWDNPSTEKIINQHKAAIEAANEKYIQARTEIVRSGFSAEGFNIKDWPETLI